MSSVAISCDFPQEGEGFIGKLPKPSKCSKFSAGLRIPCNIGSEPSAHAEEEETGREFLQVPENGIHEAAERIRLISKTTLFKISTVLAYYTWRGNTCVPLFFPRTVHSQGELESKCHLSRNWPLTPEVQRISGWMYIGGLH